MTPAEFKQIREASTMAHDEIAVYLGGVHTRSVQKWEYGERPIPPPVEKLMGILNRENQEAGRA